MMNHHKKKRFVSKQNITKTFPLLMLSCPGCTLPFALKSTLIGLSDTVGGIENK